MLVSTHVETVALLTRKNAVKDYVYVDVDVKELGGGPSVKKATYKQIKEYVEETHGLKVHTANIAAMKDELGLEKQFSYDEAGMAAKKRPGVPQEKRDAIIDAFRHFGMIE